LNDSIPPPDDLPVRGHVKWGCNCRFHRYSGSR
jgi:hypothetical protein